MPQSSLTIFVVPLRAVPYALAAHQPDWLFSVMPRNELDGSIPAPTKPLKHRWCEVHDCHFGEEDLSPLARRRTIAGFKAEYGRDTPHLITGIKARELLLQIDELICKAHVTPQTAVFHCHGGISRSQAAAYITLCQIFGPGRENEAFTALRTANHYATPNPMLVWQADRILKRDGRMSAALSLNTDSAEKSAANGLKIEFPTKKNSLVSFY